MTEVLATPDVVVVGAAWGEAVKKTTVRPAIATTNSAESTEV
jgi:hypothetical protein